MANTYDKQPTPKGQVLSPEPVTLKLPVLDTVTPAPTPDRWAPPMPATACKELLNKMGPLLDLLYNRWQDEKEYEDFNDYKLAFQKALPVPLVFVSATSTPFRFYFMFGVLKYSLTVTPKTIKLTEHWEK